MSGPWIKHTIQITSHVSDLTAVFRKLELKMFRTRSKHESGLLELPAELRATIFEYALTSDKPVVAFLLDAYQRESYQEATQPFLTRISRQVRHESLPLFYGCNEIVLHTEERRAQEALRWLEHIQVHLAKLQRISFWLRYATLTNERSSAVGALSVSLEHSVRDGAWHVDKEWKWITVVRKPASVRGDGEFLVKTLRSLIGGRSRDTMGARDYFEVMTDIRMLYVKDKMM